MPHMVVPPSGISPAVYHPSGGACVDDSKSGTTGFRWPVVQASTESRSHEDYQALADRFCFLECWRLHHHPYERLGATRPQQDAAAALKRPRLLLDRRVDLSGLLEGSAIAYTDVDERLRQLLHRVAIREIRRAECLQRQQRGRDAVTGRDEVAVDDVPGLLAAERPL